MRALTACTLSCLIEFHCEAVRRMPLKRYHVNENGIICFLLLTLSHELFVFVCARPGWVYLWTAQTERMTHINTSSRARERAAKAKLKSAPASRRPSTRRREKARRGTLLLDLLHLYFYSYFPLQVYDSYDFITCPGGS